MKNLKLPLLCAILVHLASAEVRIDDSTITGTTVEFDDAKADEYLGIPYAEPPVGARRFLKPKPITSYPQELQATINPPACPQYCEKPFPWYPEDAPKNEDCLYLNVWVPSQASQVNKKPVLYWVNGALHRYGPFANGTRLSVKGDIVVVTVGYRKGYFGFLTSNSEDAPGNVGLYDVLEGLKWVNKHIEAFGGDKSKVTIGGQGSGAVIVGLLAISPLADGLFARQILETSSPAYRRADNNTQNLAFSQEVAKYFKCANDSYTIDKKPKEVVECLRGVEADKLSQADYDLAEEEPYHLVPQWGDAILPKNPREAVMSGDWNCTDLFMGSNDGDGGFFVTSYENKDKYGFYGEKLIRVNKSDAQNLIRKQAEPFPDPEAIVKHYIPDDLEINGDGDYLYVRYTILMSSGELNTICPAIYYARKCAEQDKKVFQYYFTRRPGPSKWATWMNAMYYDEVQFVFGVPVNATGYRQFEEQLSYDMMAAWSGFVKNGQPTDKWPLYNNDTRLYKKIQTDISERDQKRWPHNEKCDFLKSHFQD